MIKPPWFTCEELQRFARIGEAQAAIDAWRPRLEYYKANPRYSSAMIAGRI
jgi:hypothetical protein